MRDVTERLRAGAMPKAIDCWGALHIEAADEIDRLRAELLARNEELDAAFCEIRGGEEKLSASQTLAAARRQIDEAGKTTVIFTEDIYDDVSESARKSFIRHRGNIRGQQMSIWDDLDAHIISATLNKVYTSGFAAPVPAQPVKLPPEIAADIRPDDYVSPRLRGELGMPSHIAELATNIRRNIAKAQQHVIADSDIEPDGEMLDLLNHMDTIAQQIETDTAQPEYPGKQNDVYTDILTGVPTCKFCVGKKSQPSAVPEAVANVVMRDDSCPHCKRY